MLAKTAILGSGAMNVRLLRFYPKNCLSGYDNIADIETQWHTASMKLGGITYAVVALFMSTAIGVTSEVAEQLRFTGQPTANVVLIKDTLRQIQLVGQA